MRGRSISQHEQHRIKHVAKLTPNSSNLVRQKSEFIEFFEFFDPSSNLQFACRTLIAASSKTQNYVHQFIK